MELLPEDRAESIVELNKWLHTKLNRTAYVAGFAKEQSTYETGCHRFFAALDKLEIRLSRSRYLHGDALTLSDLFLLPMLIRFEVAYYYAHFKLNLRKLSDYPALNRFMLDLMKMPILRQSVDIEHIKLHYCFAHEYDPFFVVFA